MSLGSPESKDRVSGLSVKPMLLFRNMIAALCLLGFTGDGSDQVKTEKEFSGETIYDSAPETVIPESDEPEDREVQGDKKSGDDRKTIIVPDNGAMA